MATKVYLSRVKALLKCIQAGGSGSSRYHTDVYQAAIDGGYLTWIAAPIFGGQWIISQKGHSLIEAP